MDRSTVRNVKAIRFPALPLEFSEIGYLLLPSRDMAEIPLKGRKSSIQPTNCCNKSKEAIYATVKVIGY